MKTQSITVGEEDREILINSLEAYAKFRGNPRGDTPKAEEARRAASRATDLAETIRLGCPT